MTLKEVINRLLQGQDLSPDQMRQWMTRIVEGRVTPVQTAGFLVALRAKGENVDEIATAAEVLREKAQRIEVAGGHLIDTCGTGGDGLDTFNVSTTAAFVVGQPEAGWPSMATVPFRAVAAVPMCSKRRGSI